MFRSMIVLLVLVTGAQAQLGVKKPKSKELVPIEFAVGQEGVMAPLWYFTVVRVVSEDSVYLVPKLPRIKTAQSKTGRQFLLKGFPTKDVADGQKADLGKVVYKVTGTTKSGSSTFFVLEPKGGDK